MVFRVPLLPLLMMTNNKVTTVDEVYNAAPDLSDVAPFLPRAILYYCYQFPLRDDGSLIVFSEKEKERGKNAITDKELAKVLHPSQEFSKVKKEMEKYFAVRDTPFWRDAPLHYMLEANMDLDGATAAWMAEPIFTKTSFIGKDVKNKQQDFHGTIVKQIYE
ncbi:unnamed protein product, partial [Cylicocyclus nassatus]